MELLKPSHIINKENINTDNSDYKIVQILKPLGYDAIVLHVYMDSHDYETDAIDILIDWTVEYDKNINHETQWSYLLQENEIREAENEGYLEDFTCGGNCGNYLSWPIMQNEFSVHNIQAEVVA